MEMGQTLRRAVRWRETTPGLPASSRGGSLLPAGLQRVPEPPGWSLLGPPNLFWSMGCVCPLGGLAVEILESPACVLTPAGAVYVCACGRRRHAHRTAQEAPHRLKNSFRVWDQRSANSRRGSRDCVLGHGEGGSPPLTHQHYGVVTPRPGHSGKHWRGGPLPAFAAWH